MIGGHGAVTHKTMNPNPLTFDYFQNCVHCGLCLPVCPTYAELRDENDSPRGRIYLMQALAEERVQLSPRIEHHLDLCLDCRACETVCPSGVQYGAMIEAHRGQTADSRTSRKSALDRLVDWVLLNIFPYPRRTRWLMRLTRLFSASGLFDFLETTRWGRDRAALLKFPSVLARVPDVTEQIATHADPPSGTRRARVGMFLGCVSESILGETNRATRRVLLRNGCAVSCPSRQVCCGAIHYHAGRAAEAAEFARANIDAFEALESDVGAIVVNVAGCGLMLKDYAKLLEGDVAYAERAKAFSQRVIDVNQFLYDLGIVPPESSLCSRVTYHEACHLCHGQGVRRAPRELLRAIPGLELVELVESDWCCGAAGSYAMTQPAMASRLARRKLAHIENSGADLVAAANAGCILHLRQFAALEKRRCKIVHPIDLLDQAYRKEASRAR